MEFIMLIILAFMIMVVFTVISRDRMVDLRKQEEYTALKDVSFSVQSELVIATNVEDGYRRVFATPETLDGINYTLEVVEEYLIARSANHEYTVKVPAFQGSVAKGNNTVRKEEGEVYLNG